MQRKFSFDGVQMPSPEELPAFPSTRYQGSKRKMLSLLAQVFNGINFTTALDLYSGSGMVTLLLRHLGKVVSANDYLQFNRMTADLFLSSESSQFNSREFSEMLNYLLNEAPLHQEPLVVSNYRGIFFLDEENLQIDRLCQNIYTSGLSAHQILSIQYCVGQALLMKRPYNLFHRANLQMRTKDVKRSFGNAKTWEASIATHALKIYNELAKFPFVKLNGELGATYNENTIDLSGLPDDFDLIYLDPPYLNARGVGLKYTDFYHFLDGLCEYKLFADGDKSNSHLPIVRKPSAWTTRGGAIDELQRVVDRWRNSILVVSYRNDGVPTEQEICEILSSYGRSVNLHAEVTYKYALSHSLETKEQVILSTP